MDVLLGLLDLVEEAGVVVPLGGQFLASRGLSSSTFELLLQPLDGGVEEC